MRRRAPPPLPPLLPILLFAAGGALLPSAAQASAPTFTCADVGGLSRGQICRDDSGRRVRCPAIPEETWAGSVQRRPSWADAVATGAGSDAGSRHLLQLQVTATAQASVCGDGWMAPGDGEQCDDGNVVDGDGCSALCAVEAGFGCLPSFTNGRYYQSQTTPVSVCVPNVCGDGKLHATEECDDGNVVAGDGCSLRCEVEANYFCRQKDGLTACEPPYCGDGKKATHEECDDGNNAPDDGCAGDCTLETTGLYVCSTACTTRCDLYANQASTRCAPDLQTDAPTPAPDVVTPTNTEYVTPTVTVSRTFEEAAKEATLTYPASKMAGLEGPCALVLEGKVGCCGHLASDADYEEHATDPVRDLARCRWPRAGYRAVASGTCEQRGHFTVETEQDCRAAALHLGLRDAHPFVADAAGSGGGRHVVNVSLLNKAGHVERLSGVYDRAGHDRYRQRREYPPGTAELQFNKGKWSLYPHSRSSQAYASSSALFGQWRRTSQEDLLFASAGTTYPLVETIGDPHMPGCTYQRSSTRLGQLVFRPLGNSSNSSAASSAAGDSLGLCSPSSRCVCRLDDPSLGAEPSGAVDAMCSYLLHQLHCGYACLAPYVPSREVGGCAKDDDCFPGSVCVFSAEKTRELADLQARLRAAVAREADYAANGPPDVSPLCGLEICKTAAVLRTLLAEARVGAVGSCRGTGEKMPPCDAWLRRVYAVCRAEPVAYIAWAAQLTPPAPHCQPLWWKYRTYEAFRAAVAPGSKPDDGSGCWSAASAGTSALRAVSLAAVAVLLAVLL